MLTFDERELGRQIRELAATIDVPTARPIATSDRVPLWPALALVAALVIVFATVAQLATPDGVTLSPGSPARLHTAMPTATPPATPSPCPSASPTPSHRATPYPGLPGPTFFPTSCVTHTITGTITELGPQGQRPAEGARVYVHLFAPHRSGHWMSDVTGADGRYELWGIFTDAIAVLTVGKGDSLNWYRKPCVHEVTVTSDMSIDMEIVPESAGGAAANAAARRGTGSFLTGVVFGQGPDGTRAPIPNAMVFLDDTLASTITDADGRYVFCGIPRRPHEVAAIAAGGYDISKNPARKIDIVGDMTLDLELKR
jgi:hypothetical protein